MTSNVWESEYFDAYDKVLLNSDIYLFVRDFHINAMMDCQKVLDSGCGTGNVAIELLRQGKQVSAIDTSKKALETLEVKCACYNEKIRIFNLNAEQLPFEDNYFNGITSMFVVHFTNDLESYLKEHYRVLRKNGIFALTGRTSGENMELVVQSYEDSLRKRNLLPQLQKELDIMKEGILNGVSKIVKSGYTFHEMKTILEKTGFKEIQEFPNPYFGQCYSLLAKK